MSKVVVQMADLAGWLKHAEEHGVVQLPAEEASELAAELERRAGILLRWNR